MKGGIIMFDLGNAILGLLVFVGLVFIVREVVMWYWKINTIVENLEAQNRLLKSIKEELQKSNARNQE